MNPWRVALRPLRFEIVAVVALALLGFAVAGSTAVRLIAYGIPHSCFDPASADPTACQAFAGALDQYRLVVDNWTTQSFLATATLPVLAALLVGVSLVGKELDQRTTVFAWSLAPSRTRWLLLRVLPMGLVLVAFSAIAGGLGDLVEGLRSPTIDQSQNFEALGVRGVTNSGAVIFVLGIALVVGAALGRVIPAILVAGAIAGGALMLTSLVSDAMLAAESVVIEVSTVDPGARMLETLVRTPEREVISWNEAYARYGNDFGAQLGAPGSGFVEMARVLPGTRYPSAAARLALLEGGVGLVAIGIAFATVQRRRP
jgi:hypothetical protein